LKKIKKINTVNILESENTTTITNDTIFTGYTALKVEKKESFHRQMTSYTPTSLFT
jgi:hypothetical protein